MRIFFFQKKQYRIMFV